MVQQPGKIEMIQQSDVERVMRETGMDELQARRHLQARNSLVMAHQRWQVLRFQQEKKQ